MIGTYAKRTGARRRMRAGLLSGAVALACALALAVCAPAAAWADSGASDADGCGLLVRCEADGAFVPGVSVSVYKVADVASDGSLVPVAPFDGYGISWDVSSADAVRALAYSLEGYVARDGVPATEAGTTDSNGVASFGAKGVGLDPGSYLVVGAPTPFAGKVYKPEASLVTLPSVGPDGVVDRAPAIEMKYELAPLDATGDLDVSKRWSGDEGAARPASVRVQLLRDGKVVQTEELNQANGWHVRWSGLSSASRWTVVEESVPEDYVLTVREDGSFVTLTNAYVGPKPPGGPSAGGQKLPQTGMLWWPVPALLIAGAALLAAGLMKRRRS